MRRSVLLPLLLLSALTGVAQAPGTVDVRLFGAEGHDEATALWVDGQGVLLAGETTSDIVMAEGQALWAPGGPIGKKGFVTAFDTALNWMWSFSFPGDVGAPLGQPSSVVVRDVVRTTQDTAVAWVLYDAPVDGQWQSNLLGVDAEQGVVAHHTWSTSGAVTSTGLLPLAGGAFHWVGWENAASVPSGATGLRLGYWSGEASDAPTFAWVEGTEGMVPAASAWWDDTTYVAVERPDPDAPAAVIAITIEDGNPTLVGQAAIADPALTLVDVAAGPQGIAWSGTLLSPDGTLDAVFGRLEGAADPLDPTAWGQSWIQETVSGADRPARALLWMGDVVQCAARTTEAGAGGSGILVQTRFGETGAWFGQFAFGGEGEEDLRAMARDQQGRLFLAGSSNSWTDLGSGNGSMDAALFRVSTPQLQNGFETTAELAVLPDAAFVGFGDPAMAEWAPSVVAMHRGDPVEFAVEQHWAVLDAAGRVQATGTGGQWTCAGPEGWRIVVESAGKGHTVRRRLWVAP